MNTRCKSNRTEFIVVNIRQLALRLFFFFADVLFKLAKRRLRLAFPPEVAKFPPQRI